jgi:REP element-mobilizing transposase RayT
MIAFHGILTAYGFWLPNDPRGSWSDFVAAWELYRAGGPATKVDTRRSVAHASHDQKKRFATKQLLLREPVTFSGLQAREIARGFARAVSRSGHEILACAIMPEHVHVVVKASSFPPRNMIGHLKREASLALKVAGIHPFQAEFEASGVLPMCWADGCWNVFLDTPEAVLRAIEYVRNNPIKEGKPVQRWSFVTPFEHRLGTRRANG